MRKTLSESLGMNLRVGWQNYGTSFLRGRTQISGHHQIMLVTRERQTYPHDLSALRLRSWCPTIAVYRLSWSDWLHDMRSQYTVFYDDGLCPFGFMHYRPTLTALVHIECDVFDYCILDTSSIGLRRMASYEQFEAIESR
jgi:hypothetical protein